MTMDSCLSCINTQYCWIVRHVCMKSSIPSNTAQPIAELRIFLDMRRDAPSKKPAAPRCSKILMTVVVKPRYLSSERTCIFVLTTSNGCVAIVAMAPADAAEKLCMPAAYAVGMKYVVSRLILSYMTTNRPAYGASRSDDATNPRISSDGPIREMERSEADKLRYAYNSLSKRAFKIENGLRINPTPTRAVAPAMRFP